MQRNFDLENEQKLWKWLKSNANEIANYEPNDTV